MSEQSLKLKIRLPSGAEFEAQGDPKFIANEKASFIRLMFAQKPQQNTSQKTPPNSPEHLSEIWQKAAEPKGQLLILKTKHREITPAEAALIIVSAAKTLTDRDSINALDLSKSLKKSGYFQGRIDRLMAAEIQSGRMLATGTKRNRAYQATEKGLAKAFTLAEKLAENLPK